MEKFLKKYLSEEQLKELKEKYIADGHADAKGLPEYISKTRLDEVLGKQHEAEGQAASLQAQLEEFKKSTQKLIDDAVKAAKDEATKHETEALDALKNDHAIDLAIYEAKGKNIKAIRALVDGSKPVKDEITRIKKSDPYLFGEDLPKGTGKQDGGSGAGSNAAELEAMRRAVGL